MVPVSFASLGFAGEEFHALRSGALYWPRLSTLLVADLHLEKSSFYARFGQMLPPYDSLATLQGLQDAIAQTGATAVWCLGDNFHDRGGEARLEGEAERALSSLCATVDWIWITGNHDPDVAGRCGGRVVGEAMLGGIRMVHHASSREGPEMSGHYHPRIVLNTRARRVARRCYVRGPDRLILPAFGALTGGLDATHPEILKAAGLARTGTLPEALVALDDRLLRFPLGPMPRMAG